MPTWLVLLANAMSNMPAEISVVEQALHDHWGQDHVQQLVKGVDYLDSLVGTIVGVAQTKATDVKTPPVPGAQGPMDTGGHGAAGQADPNATC